MQWIPILEEYSPELIDIQGSKNIAADVWSRLDVIDTQNLYQNDIKSVYEYNGSENADILHLSTKYKTIMQNDKNRTE